MACKIDNWALYCLRYLISNLACVYTTSVADPHQLDADPDPACYFDGDPVADPDSASHFDTVQIRILLVVLTRVRILHFTKADPDPSFQTKAQTLEKELK
jgi:hypothetical protein